MAPGLGVGVAREEPRAHSARSPPNPAPRPTHPVPAPPSFPAPFPRSFLEVCPFLPRPTHPGVRLPSTLLQPHAPPSAVRFTHYPRWHSQPKRSFHEVHPNPPTRDPPPRSSSMVPPMLLPLLCLRTSGSAFLPTQTAPDKPAAVPSITTQSLRLTRERRRGMTLGTPPATTPWLSLG